MFNPRHFNFLLNPIHFFLLILVIYQYFFQALVHKRNHQQQYAKAEEGCYFSAFGNVADIVHKQLEQSNGK